MVNSLYRRVSRKRVCLICGKPDWCSYEPDGNISFCARVTANADRISKTGWGIFYHNSSGSFLTRPPPPRPVSRLRFPALASIKVRDFVYRKLIEFAPATLSTEIVSGPKGLLPRKILDVENYGSLPQCQAERDVIANQIEGQLNWRFPDCFPILKTKRYGIPGFWMDHRGKTRLWRDRDYSKPMMLIPFRNPTGLIQACQIRFMGSVAARNSPRYLWLSNPEKAGGSSSGTPLHFARYHPNCIDTPLLVTEGALKAETVRSFEKDLDIIGSGGVSCSHDKIIVAARFRQLVLAFDQDWAHNPHVARSIARLLFCRILDEQNRHYKQTVKILFWTNRAKGIDDAILCNAPISQLTIAEWLDALTTTGRSEVERYIKQSGRSITTLIGRLQ